MKFCSRFQLRATTALALVALGATAPFWTAPARTAPILNSNRSQPWPGRRPLLVLPVTVGATWNADAALGRALAPIAQADLQEALGQTNKFSAMAAHRFNPILQRGLVEKQLTEADIAPFVTAPSLEGAQAIAAKLSFEQPLMIVDVKLESLIPGGTAKAPTVQVSVSGNLYEQGNPAPVRTLNVTSRPTGGKAPASRLEAALQQALTELARGFVMTESLPDLAALLPEAPTPTPKGGAARPTPSPMPGMMPMMPGAMPGSTPVPPPAIAAPNSLPAAPGTPLVPPLPAPQPPLGVADGEMAQG